MAIVYKIGFKADVSNVSSALKTIEADIQNAFKKSMGPNRLNEGLQKGIQQAQLLESALKKATTDKGVSFVRLNTELEKAGSSAAQMVAALSGAGMQDSLNSFLETFAAADRNIVGLSRRIKELGRVMTQSFKFSMAQEGLQAMRSILSDSIRYVQDLDQAFNQIQIVTGKSAQSMAEVTEKTLKSARELRVSAQDYADASLIFYQQGLSDDQVDARTETTVKAAKAAGESVSQMSQELTAVWNTYQMEGEQLERAASIGAKLGAETAVDFKYIAEAMGIAATSAAQLGTSYESLSSIIATVGSVTQQSASVVGTAYRTIFTRLSNLKLDGETEDGVKLGQITKQLAEVGVNALDANGELRKTDELIMELGTHWGEYSQAQQAAIAQVVGGTRQFGQFLALMQNFDAYLQNLQSAQSETDGSTLEQQYLTSIDTIDTAMTNAQEAWRRGFAEIFTSEGQKGFYNFLEDAGNLFTEIVEGAGGLEGILKGVGAYLIRYIVPAFNNIKITMSQLWNNRNQEAQIEYMKKQIEEMAVTSANFANNMAKVGVGAQRNVTEGQAAQMSAPQTTGTSNYNQERIKWTQNLAEQYIKLNALKQSSNSLDQVAAEQGLMNLKSIHEEVNASYDLLDANQELEKSVAKIAKSYADRAEKAKGEDTASMLDDQAKAIKTMDEMMKKATKTAENFNGEFTQDDFDKFQADLDDITERMSSFGEGEFSDRLAEELTDISKRMGSELDENTLGIYMEEAAAAFEKYQKGVQGSAQESDLFSGAAEKLAQGLRNATSAEEGFANSNVRLNNQSKLTEAQLKRAALASQSFAQTIADSVSSVGMLATGVDNLTTSIASGEMSFGNFIGSMLTIIPAIIDITKGLTKITPLYKNLLAFQEKLVVATKAKTGADAAETTGIWAKVAAKMAENAATLILVAAIVILIALVIAAVAAYKSWQKSKEDSAKANIEVAETLRSQREEIEQTTEAVKQNEQAWRESISTGESTEEKYRNLQDSLIDLNTQLANAGVNQDKLNALMAEGLRSGDLSEYYDAVGESLEELNQKQLEANKLAAEGEVFLAEREAKDTSGGRRWIGGRSDGKASEIAEVMRRHEGKSVVEDSTTAFGGATLELDTKNMSKFLEQYRDLIELQRELREIGAENSDEYREVTEFLTDFSESYNKVSEMANENAKIGAEQLKSLAEQLNAQALTTGDLAGSYDALTEAVKNFALANGLGTAEAESLLNVLTAQNDALASYSKNLDLAGTLASRILTVRNKDQGIGKTLDNQIKRARELNSAILETEQRAAETQMAAAKYDRPAFTTYNSPYAQESSKATKAAEDARKAAEEAPKAAAKAWEEVEETEKRYRKAYQDDYESLQKEIAEKLSKLSPEEQEIGAKINLENVDTWEDFTKSIDAYKDFDLKINVDVQKDPDSIIANSNTIQENLQPAVDEFQDDGYVSNDTAYELLQKGPEYRRYLVETAEGFKLTAEAANVFNQSIKDEEEALKDMLYHLDDVDNSLYDFGQNMNQLGYLTDPMSEELKNLTLSLSDLAVQLINNPAEAQIDELFSGIERALSSIDDETLEAFDVDALEIYGKALSGINEGLGDYVTSLYDSVEAGEMSLTDYEKTVSKVAKSTIKSNEQQIKVLNQKAKADEENAEEYSKYAKEIEDANKELQKSIDFEEIYNTEGIKDQFDDLFNEDYTLKTGIEWDSSELDDFKTDVDSAFNALRDEANRLPTSLYTSWLQTLNTMQGISADQRAIYQKELTDFYNGSKTIDQLSATTAGIIAGDTTAVMNNMAAKTNEAMAAAATSIEDCDYIIKFIPEGQLTFSFPKLGDLVDAFIHGKSYTIGMTGSMTLGIDPIKMGGGSGGGDYIPTSMPTPGPSRTGPADPSDFFNSGNSSAPSGDGGGGGGDDGGGGGDDEPLGPKDFERHERVEQFESVIERYDNINTSLESIERTLEAIERSEDALYGTAAYKNLEKKEKILQKQANTYRELQKQAEAYLLEDQANLQTLISNIGLDIAPIFNENGDVMNKEEIQRALDAYLKPYYEAYETATKEYNAERDAATIDFNASGQTQDDQDVFDARVEPFQKAMDNAKADLDDVIEFTVQPILDAIELVGESAETAAEAAADAAEKEIERVETYLERLQKTMEDRMDINEFDIDILDYMSEKLGEDPKNAVQLIKNGVSQAHSLANSLDATRDHANELIYKLQHGLYSSPEERDLMIQQLGDVADEMLGVMGDLQEQNQELFEAWTNTFETYIDDFDILISKSDNYLDNLTTIQEILENRGITRQDADLGLDVLESQIEVGGDRLKNLNDVKTWTEKQAKAATDAYWNAVNSGADEQSIRFLKEQMEMANEAADEAYSELLSGMNDYLSQVKDAQASAIEYIHQEWVSSLGGMFSDFSQAQDLYSQRKEIDDFYMHDNDKIYELDSLIRDINEQIENTSDPEQLEKYNQLLDEINAKKEDGVKMTETDMQILKAQVDLEKTRMSLEEARNAKNSMRLARDASGNWSYVYSQDNSEVEDQVQKMEDQMHNLDKMRRDALEEYEDFWLTVMTGYSDHLASFDQTLYDTNEGYRRWFDEKRKMYEEQLNLNADQIKKYLGETGIDFEDTALGYVTDMDSIIDANEKYKETANRTFNEIRDTTREYANKAEEDMRKVGWAYEDTAEAAEKEVDKIMTQNSYLREDMFVTYVQADSNMEAIRSAQTAWQETWTLNMSKMIEANEAFLISIQNIRKEFSGYDIANQMKEHIGNYGGVDYVYKPGENEYLDAYIAQAIEQRGLKWETLTEEQKAEFMNNDQFFKLITTFSNSEQDMMQREIDISKSDWETKKAAWIDNSDGVWHGDLGIYLTALKNAGLTDTALYRDLRVARQAKMDMQRYFANLPEEEGGRPDLRWWKSAEEYWTEYEKYAEGGYTGNGSLSKGDHIPALLSSQEYVLNPEDTKNILHAVKVTRDIVQARVNGVLSNLAAQYLNITPQTGTQQSELKQKVKIEANFPNVQNRTEIEAAFDNLINKAAQYVLKDE